MIKKIDLMIVGGHKAGTTSLKNYLSEHPDIVSHLQRDMKYFMLDEEYYKGFEKAYIKFMNKGNLIDPKVVVAKDAGTYSKIEDLARIKEHNKNCKIVLVVRNPVERAFSHYKFEVSKGNREIDFDYISQHLKNDEENTLYNHILDLGKYSDYLDNIYRHFEDQNVKVLLFEEMVSKPVEICQEIFNWLDLDDNFIPQVDRVHNKSKSPKYKWVSIIETKLKKNHNFRKFLQNVLPVKVYTRLVLLMYQVNKSEKKFEKMDIVLENELIKFYKPYNDRLEKMTKLDLSVWNQ